MKWLVNFECSCMCARTRRDVVCKIKLNNSCVQLK